MSSASFPRGGKEFHVCMYVHRSSSLSNQMQPHCKTLLCGVVAIAGYMVYCTQKVCYDVFLALGLWSGGARRSVAHLCNLSPAHKLWMHPTSLPALPCAPLCAQSRRRVLCLRVGRFSVPPACYLVLCLSRNFRLDQDLHAPDAPAFALALASLPAARRL